MVDIQYMLHEKFDSIVENTKFNVIKGIDSDVRLDLQNCDIDLYPVNKKDIRNIKCEAEIIKELEAPVNINDRLRRNYNIYRRKCNIASRYFIQ